MPLRGGPPPAELWARGKRAGRIRTASVAAGVLVLGVVGTGLGLSLSDGDGDGDRFDPEPAEPVRIQLPIEYPDGDELPDLGTGPGPLAAIWVDDLEGRGGSEVVGLVAATGRFGTLPVDVSVDSEDAFDTGIALSPDGRRIAYASPAGELVVRDLVTGESDSPALEAESGAP